MVRLWLPVGLALYGLSALLALAWHTELHGRLGALGRLLGWVDARASRARRAHVWLASAALVGLLCGLILTVGSQASYRDPLTYHEGVATWLAGGNPYLPVGPNQAEIAYTTPFVAELAPFVALLGLDGVFLALGALALLLGPLVHRAAEAYRGDPRLAAYAGMLTVTTPMLGFYTVRFAGEDIWVALSVVAAFLLFSRGKIVWALVVASLLSIKYTTFLPVIAWCLGALREGSLIEKVRRGARWAAAVAVPYLAILVPSWWAWGTPYTYAIYVQTTVERSANLRPTVNLYHLTELTGVQPPRFMFLVILAVLGLAYVHSYQQGTGDLALTGAGVVAVALFVINGVSADFVMWLLPLVVLYTLAHSQQLPSVSPLLAVVLGGAFHAHDMARFTLSGPVQRAATGSLALVVAGTLLLVVYHWIRLGRAGGLQKRTRGASGTGSG